MPKFSANKIKVLKKRFLEAIDKNHGFVWITLKETNISTTLYYRWMREDAEFSEKIYNINQTNLDFAEMQLFKNMKEGKEASNIFYLKCKGKERGYIDKVQLEGQIDHNVKQLVINVIDDETRLLMDKMKNDVKIIDKNNQVIDDK